MVSVCDAEQHLFQALRARAAGNVLEHLRGEQPIRQLTLTGTAVIDGMRTGRAAAAADRGRSDRSLASPLMIGEEATVRRGLGLADPGWENAVLLDMIEATARRPGWSRGPQRSRG